jgi:hypothetical protein
MEATVWKVTSVTSPNNEPYKVEKLKSICKEDHCYFTCKAAPCNLLCHHLYSCDCPDGERLCKHIHKVREMDLRESINQVIFYFYSHFLFLFNFFVCLQRAIVSESHTQLCNTAPGTTNILSFCPYDLMSDDEKDDMEKSGPEFINGDSKDDILNRKMTDLEEVKKISEDILKILQAQEKEKHPHTNSRNYLGMLKHWNNIVRTDINSNATHSLKPLTNSPRVQPNSNFAKQPTFKSIKKKKKKGVAKKQGLRMINAQQQQVKKNIFCM